MKKCHITLTVTIYQAHNLSKATRSFKQRYQSALKSATQCLYIFYMGLSMRKKTNCVACEQNGTYAQTKPSSFAFCKLLSILASDKISIVKLVTVAEQPWFGLTWSRIPLTNILTTRPVSILLALQFMRTPTSEQQVSLYVFRIVRNGLKQTVFRPTSDVLPSYIGGASF